MALLPTQSFAPAGSALTYQAAAGGGDSVVHRNDLVLHVKNGGGAPIDVTIDCPVACSHGVVNNAHDKVVSVPAGLERFIPIDEDRFRDPVDGEANIAYSAVTTVTVAVFRK